MRWTHILLSLAVILLYVPMVFMAANVIYPDAHEFPFFDYCYKPLPPGEETNSTELKACRENERVEREAFEAKRRAYESKKYILVTVANLAVIFVALFIKFDPTIVIGLFLGAVAATFGATIRYFDTQSKIGLLVLALIFTVTLFFITKHKSILRHF